MDDDQLASLFSFCFSTEKWCIRRKYDEREDKKSAHRSGKAAFDRVGRAKESGLMQDRAGLSVSEGVLQPHHMLVGKSQEGGRRALILINRISHLIFTDDA